MILPRTHNQSFIFQNNLKLLNEGMNQKQLMNEAPEVLPERIWKTFRYLMGRHFMNKHKSSSLFLQNILRNQMDGTGKVIFHINKSGHTRYGKTIAAQNVMRELNSKWTPLGWSKHEIAELFVNIDGAHIVRTEAGECFYMTPEGGYIPLPVGFNPDTMDLPASCGHISWWEYGYTSPIMATATGAALAAITADLYADQIMNQDQWHPPMELPPDFEGIPQYGSGYIPPYISRPIEDISA